MSSASPFFVSVIIVNYNGGPLIQQAINRLKTQRRMPDEVIIVDNASSDGSAHQLDLDGLDEARLIRLEENVGFAAANNIAARQAQGNWIVLLNPDALAEPDWLHKLEDATKRHPGVSVFACAQIDAEDSTRLDGAGDSYSVLGFPWRGGFGREVGELPREGECFSPCGASALYRRDLFLDAGGFDESYFCYCEDVDLGYRLRLTGERCVFVPGAVVRHYGSAITGRYSDFTVRLGTRNRLTTYLKNTPPLLLAASLPGHVLLTFCLYLTMLGKPRARSMRSGLWQALKKLPETRAARKDVQRQRRLSSAAIARALSWNPIRLVQRRPHVWALDTPSETSPAGPQSGKAPAHSP